MLRYVSIVEIGYSEVKEHVQNEGEIEQSEIRTIGLSTNLILHGSVNSEDPEWLDQQIQEKKKCEVGEKFPLHGQRKSSTCNHSRLAFITLARCELQSIHGSY